MFLDLKLFHGMKKIFLFEKFRNNTNNHFKTTKVVNVYIIHKQCRGEKVPDGNQKDRKTIKEKDVS